MGLRSLAAEAAESSLGSGAVTAPVLLLCTLVGALMLSAWVVLDLKQTQSSSQDFSCGRGEGAGGRVGFAKGGGGLNPPTSGLDPPPTSGLDHPTSVFVVMYFVQEFLATPS